MQYLPASEVPSSRKRHSFGPTNSYVMETPSPILYKRSRTEMEEVVETSSAKRLKAHADGEHLKADSEEKVRLYHHWIQRVREVPV